MDLLLGVSVLVNERHTLAAYAVLWDLCMSKLLSLSNPFLWQQWQSRKLCSSSLFSWPSPWPVAASPRQVMLSGPWVAIFSITSGSRGHNYQAESTSLQTSIKIQQCFSCIGWISWEWSALFVFTKGGLSSFPGLFPLEEYCYVHQPEQQIKPLSCPGTCGFGETERTSLKSLWHLSHFREITNQEKGVSFGSGEAKGKESLHFSQKYMDFTISLS